MLLRHFFPVVAVVVHTENEEIGVFFFVCSFGVAYEVHMKPADRHIFSAGLVIPIVIPVHLFYPLTKD